MGNRGSKKSHFDNLSQEERMVLTQRMMQMNQQQNDYNSSLSNEPLMSTSDRISFLVQEQRSTVKLVEADPTKTEGFGLIMAKNAKKYTYYQQENQYLLPKQEGIGENMEGVYIVIPWDPFVSPIENFDRREYYYLDEHAKNKPLKIEYMPLWIQTVDATNNNSIFKKKEKKKSLISNIMFEWEKGHKKKNGDADIYVLNDSRKIEAYRWSELQSLVKKASIKKMRSNGANKYTGNSKAEKLYKMYTSLSTMFSKYDTDTLLKLN